MNQYTVKSANMGNVQVSDYSDNSQAYNTLQMYTGSSSYPNLEEYKQRLGGNQISGIGSIAVQPKKETKKMSLAKNKRGLFQVILIDPKEKKVLLNTIVISDSVEDVLLEVNAGDVIKTAGLSVSDVDKIVNVLGQVRKTRKAKTGEVEIVNDEETKD